MSSSWISSGQGQSSPALKFNRMLICREQKISKIRRAESREGNKNKTRNLFRKHKGEEKRMKEESFFFTNMQKDESKIMTEYSRQSQFHFVSEANYKSLNIDEMLPQSKKIQCPVQATPVSISVTVF